MENELIEPDFMPNNDDLKAHFDGYVSGVLDGMEMSFYIVKMEEN